MAVLDKKLLLADIESKMHGYIPADTVRRIITDVAEVMTNYEVTRNGGPDGGPDRESEQLLNLFLDAKKIEGKSVNTINLYRYVLNKLLEGVNAPFKSMTVYHLRQFMMLEKERGVSMNTIKHNGWVYSSYFGWLFKEGLIPANPTVNLGQIKAKVQKELPFTGEQIQLIKESCRNDCETAIVHFLLSTGCRISEACSVNRSDIDYANLKLEVTGKGDKTRTVYIDNVTAMMLKRYLSERKDIDPALFYSRIGQRFTPNGIRAMLKRIEDRSHVPGVHPHRFRHTLATNLIDRGMSVQEVAIILGHSKLDTTMTYIHINERNTENAYRKYACM